PQGPGVARGRGEAARPGHARRSGGGHLCRAPGQGLHGVRPSGAARGPRPRRAGRSLDREPRRDHHRPRVRRRGDRGRAHRRPDRRGPSRPDDRAAQRARGARGRRAAVRADAAGDAGAHGPRGLSYRSRRAAVTGSRAARIAGGTPPARPMSSAKARPKPRRSGVTRKAKARCEKVWKFMVEVVRPFRGSTARHPSRPPASETNRASRTNETTTAPPPKPTARMVATSRVRSATAEYIVFKAAKTAPTPMTRATIE